MKTPSMSFRSPAPSPSLLITRAPHDPGLVFLSGPFDERSVGVLGALFSGATPPPRFDLAGVTHVTSSGVRSWLMLLAARRAARPVELERCGSNMQYHMVILPALLRAASVRSILAGYHCDACATADGVLLRLDGAATTLAELGTPICARCADPMQADDATREFLAVLAEADLREGAQETSVARPRTGGVTTTRCEVDANGGTEALRADRKAER